LQLLHIFIFKLLAAGTDFKNTGLLPATAKFAVKYRPSGNPVDDLASVGIFFKLREPRTLEMLQAPRYLNPALGTRTDKHTKKLEGNNYAGTLSWKVFIASQGH